MRFALTVHINLRVVLWLSSYIQSCVRLDLQLRPLVSVHILLASPYLLSFLFVIGASDKTLDVW